MKFESGYYKHCLLAFAFVSMLVQVCFAQIEFTEHNIADDFDGATDIHAADIDGDGDMDVLGTAAVADDITWWESDLDPERIEEPPHSDVPEEFILYNAYPNPFNATTQVRFGLPNRSTVRINVLDLYGRTVAMLAEHTYEAGFHSVAWDATAFPTGIYLVRLEAGGRCADC